MFMALNPISRYVFFFVFFESLYFGQSHQLLIISRNLQKKIGQIHSGPLYIDCTVIHSDVGCEKPH